MARGCRDHSEAAAACDFWTGVESLGGRGVACDAVQVIACSDVKLFQQQHGFVATVCPFGHVMLPQALLDMWSAVQTREAAHAACEALQLQQPSLLDDARVSMR